MGNFRITIIISLIIISVVLFSCGPSHRLTNSVSYQDNDFSYDQIKNNGVIIGGVSSQLIRLTPEERIEYSTLLSNVFLEKLKDAQNIHVVNTLQFIDQIGKEKYFEIMEHYDTEEYLEPETIHFLNDAFPDVKYIFFAHINNENIVDKTYEDYDDNGDGIRDKEITYEKTYLLTVQFKMYDIPGVKMALDNIIYNEARNVESRADPDGCVESCMSSIIQEIIFGEPAPIDRKDVLAKISEKFAKDLAKI